MNYDDRYHCIWCGKTSDFAIHVRGYHHVPGKLCLLCDVEAEIINKRMKSEGYEYSQKAWRLPLSDVVLTWDEARKKLKDDYLQIAKIIQGELQQ